MDDVTLNNLKREIKETEYRYFTDEDINYYYTKNSDNFNATVYECLLLKAEETTINLTGIRAQDNSAYFRRIASRYRPCNSGVLPT